MSAANLWRAVHDAGIANDARASILDIASRGLKSGREFTGRFCLPNNPVLLRSTAFEMKGAALI